MRPIDERIEFKPVTRGDLPLLLEWFKEPHMQEWWGEPDEELAMVRDMVEGRDSTRPFLIQLDGQPVGYIQYWFLGEIQTPEWLEDHPWLQAFPADAVGVDLSIGEPGLLARGIGSSALRLFARRLYDSGYTTIVIDPDPENARAVRAYEKAGFRPVPGVPGSGEDVLIMQFQF
ncbi:GNAT family N-acetyltransferase [Gellertiella hungarica]|uniref:Aminoglycoside 6'-N-acetyltransferase n=1 Tax=Gellertiella hungarica TaxID=1572859 RepID=A0A7W6J8U0_9HYPH|nr:GNAT family N-acetyltransferase [Gellertiella hungarica]MBB4066901.1 aminoglycoside 6'-N-acetyltransferase [Gellertiella hungarica]